MSVLLGASTPFIPLLGYYTDANSKAGIDSLGSFLSVAPNGYEFFVSGNTWSSIANPWSGTYNGQNPGVAHGQFVLLSVPLCPSGSGVSTVASNLSTFTTLATALVGTPTIIRLGWEFDGVGYGFPWSPGVNGNTAGGYASAFASAVGAMRSANPKLRYDFCCAIGSSNLSQLQSFYPGDAYVDFIGGDHYDNVGGGGDASQYGPPVNLASSRGKPLSCGEWGLNGTDDPTFINDMAQLFLDPGAAATRYSWPHYMVGYQSYFSFNGSINSDITQFPNSAAAFTADFG